MRSKEEAHDYRYFPDPDLLPLEFDEAYVDGARERPAGTAGRQEGALHRRLRPLALRRRRVSSPSATPPISSRTVAKGRDGKTAANWVINELFGRLNKEGHDIERLAGLGATQLGGIIDLIGEGVISGKIAKDLFEIVWTRRRRSARRSSRPRGLKQVTDTGAIEKAVDAIIAANPGQGRAGEGEADPARLVRRPGHEGDRRQGQPAGRQRDPEGEARDLSP